jgi:hypothetical protein
MSDKEWEDWKAAYEREGRGVPTVLKRARTDRLRAFIGVGGVYAICAGLLVAAIGELRQATGALALVVPLLLIALVVVMIAGVSLAMRGTFGRGDGTPLALLAEMERRHAGRRRLIRFLPWITGASVASTIGVGVVATVAAGFDAGGALATLAVCGVTVWCVWFVRRRVGRMIDRDLREAAEARRLLAEGAEGSEDARP